MNQAHLRVDLCPISITTPGAYRRALALLEWNQAQGIDTWELEDTETETLLYVDVEPLEDEDFLDIETYIQTAVVTRMGKAQVVSPPYLKAVASQRL